MVVPKRW